MKISINTRSVTVGSVLCDHRNITKARARDTQIIFVCENGTTKKERYTIAIRILRHGIDFTHFISFHFNSTPTYGMGSIFGGIAFFMGTSYSDKAGTKNRSCNNNDINDGWLTIVFFLLQY